MGLIRLCKVNVGDKSTPIITFVDNRICHLVGYRLIDDFPSSKNTSINSAELRDSIIIIIIIVINIIYSLSLIRHCLVSLRVVTD